MEIIMLPEKGAEACPHCGGKNLVLQGELAEFLDKWGEDGWGQGQILDELERHADWQVVCPVNSGGCGASGPWKPSQGEALTAWNHRMLENRLRAELANAGRQL